MYERAQAIDLIERAIDGDPYCPACDAPTEVADEGGVLVLRCAAAAAPHGVLARIGAALLPHLHRDILDLSEGIAA